MYTTGDFTPRKAEITAAEYMIEADCCEAELIRGASELIDQLREEIPYVKIRLNWTKDKPAVLLGMNPFWFLMRHYEPPVKEFITEAPGLSPCPGRLSLIAPDSAVDAARAAWETVVQHNPICSSQLRIVRSSLSAEVIAETLSDIILQESEAGEGLLDREPIESLTEACGITTTGELLEALTGSLFLSEDEKTLIRKVFPHISEAETSGETLDKLGIGIMYLVVLGQEKTERFLNSSERENVIEFVKTDCESYRNANTIIYAIEALISIVEERYLRENFSADFYRNYYASASTELVGRIMKRDPVEMQRRIEAFEGLLNQEQYQLLSDCINAICDLLKTGLAMHREGHKLSRFFLVQDDPETGATVLTTK